jgi:hypothetical protein
MGRGNSQDGTGLLNPSFNVKKGVVFTGKIKKKEKDLVLALRKVLLESPDLLKIRYRWSEHPIYGHCYVATEALYHLLGGKEEGWSGYVYGFEDEFDWEPGENTHWWLQNEDGRIIDATADQFEGVQWVRFQRSARNWFQQYCRRFSGLSASPSFLA